MCFACQLIFKGYEYIYQISHMYGMVPVKLCVSLVTVCVCVAILRSLAIDYRKRHCICVCVCVSLCDRLAHI